ncbi:MAG: N-acetylglucosamine-6-phosphate deacetylase [Oscillospiraceae bacterium]|jgi:N-acetylglucosamine-6-phosphate deacetylase|nr:N-acetylglucosamine-6-phosphate deacetylase [Oscillospiraceae bacterium]
MDVLIRNAKIYAENGPFSGDLGIRDGKIAALGERLSERGWEHVMDAQGLRLLPGFIDIHVHGALGRDVSDALPESLDAISQMLAAKGVTSFCPTTMTLPPEQLEAAVLAVSAFIGSERGAYVHGVHLEGPFISLGKCGAQDARSARWPTMEEFERLCRMGPVKIISMAPELPGALGFARQASERCCVSMAHTEADYDQARAAIAAGFRHATHLFCAMTGLHHRAPGLVGAVLDDPHVTAELIGDGVHLHPAAVRLAMRLLGEDRAVLVSDAVAAAGLPEGAYALGGNTYYRRGGAVYLEGNTLAGSSSHLYDEFRNLLSWGIDERAALKAATINPARVIGVDGETGSIAKGKAADLLLADEDWNLRSVFLRGRNLTEEPDGLQEDLQENYAFMMNNSAAED